MKYKLLATDLDGTLLNKEAALTPLNIAAIKKARTLGLNTIIASGRSHESIKKFNKDLGLVDENTFGISFNGSVVYRANTMEVLFESLIKPYDCMEIYRVVKAYDKDAPLILYTMPGDKVYYEVDDENIDRYYTYTNMNALRVPNLRAIAKNGAAKFLVRKEPAELQKFYEAVRGELESVCELVFSTPHLLEFGVLGNNKAVGLEFLAGYLGISMEEVVAVGDNYNDLEMIKAAGLGVAVANAVPEIKEAADYITKSDNGEDALAEVVEMLLSENKA
ncbi:MAG: Cof-type HAD-IIB family hydrolase [Defluviitaleaceae bacterium]|nr:Cof-type HAD-IIB family hydrolase [Defluviitaleaceae bacterium]